MNRRVWVSTSQQLGERGQKIVRCTYRGQAASALVVRFAGQVVGYLNRCVHMPFRLDCESSDILDAARKHIKCSMHGIIYDPLSGASVSTALCTDRKLTRIRVIEQDDNIWLDDRKVAPVEAAKPSLSS